MVNKAKGLFQVYKLTIQAISLNKDFFLEQFSWEKPLPFISVEATFFKG